MLRQPRKQKEGPVRQAECSAVVPPSCARPVVGVRTHLPLCDALQAAEPNPQEEHARAPPDIRRHGCAARTLCAAHTLWDATGMGLQHRCRPIPVGTVAHAGTGHARPGGVCGPVALTRARARARARARHVDEMAPGIGERHGPLISMHPAVAARMSQVATKGYRRGGRHTSKRHVTRLTGVCCRLHGVLQVTWRVMVEYWSL